ncbi:MAG: Gfo/Idh/MocA family oxidoreductase [Armatimonadetes bacterium]|nr:Gfo/Idh/MocA family oxidoreductase [Armatimonadota bacterium]
MANPTHPDFLPTGHPTAVSRYRFGFRKPEERLGLGVIGLHEGHTALVAMRTSGLCRAVAGCDLSQEKRDAAVSAAPGIFVTDDYDAMLARNDVHIIGIYTPDTFHAEHIIRAFEAGKHVVCTKPVLNDPSQAAAVRDAGRKANRRLQVGQSTRFYEPFQRQRELFEAGAFGDVEVFDAHYNHRMDWYYEKSPWVVDGTHWAYLGLSHPVDLIRWYLGPIREVHAYGMTTSLGQRFGLKTPDAITVNLIAENAKVGRVLGNYGFHELPKARALIEGFLMGSEGTSLARYPDLRVTYHDKQGTEIEEDFHHALSGYYFRHELKGMHYGEFCNYYDYFANCILNNKPNSPDLDEGLDTLLTMGAIVQSLETGQPVKVPRDS